MVSLSIFPYCPLILRYSFILLADNVTSVDWVDWGEGIEEGVASSQEVKHIDISKIIAKTDKNFFMVKTPFAVT